MSLPVRNQDLHSESRLLQSQRTWASKALYKQQTTVIGTKEEKAAAATLKFFCKIQSPKNKVNQEEQRKTLCQIHQHKIWKSVWFLVTSPGKQYGFAYSVSSWSYFILHVLVVGLLTSHQPLLDCRLLPLPHHQASLGATGCRRLLAPRHSQSHQKHFNPSPLGCEPMILVFENLDNSRELCPAFENRNFGKKLN